MCCAVFCLFVCKPQRKEGKLQLKDATTHILQSLYVSKLTGEQPLKYYLLTESLLQSLGSMQFTQQAGSVNLPKASSLQQNMKMTETGMLFVD